MDTIQKINIMSQALKNAVDGRFLAQEHASAVFKNLLKASGFELENKKKEVKEVEK